MVGVAETAADGVALAPLPAPAVALSPRPELQLPCSDGSFLSFLEQTGGVADANIEDSSWEQFPVGGSEGLDLR